MTSSSLLDSYKALSASAPRSAVSATLRSIIASPSDSDSANLVQLILDDVVSVDNGESRLAQTDIALALLTIKTLGHSPDASEIIALDHNMTSLFQLAKSLSDIEASNLALKCVANAMLLIPSARHTWLAAGVEGGTTAMNILEQAQSLDRIFLSCRILFLGTTSKDSEPVTNFLRELVELNRSYGKTPQTGLNVIVTTLEALIQSILSNAAMSLEAITDLLKFIFNILVHYPKIADDSEPQHPGSLQDRFQDKEDAVMGDYWNARLQPLLSPLLQMFTSIPIKADAPLAAPTSHLIHALISIPLNSSTSAVWFKQSQSNHTAPSQSEAFIQARRLFDSALSHYLPGKVDPDDASVRARCDAEAKNTLEDLLRPLVILITRMASADVDIKLSLRKSIIPPDLDRKVALESRTDTLGRCLRLLPSVYHPQLRDAIGELLFTLSDSDASTLSALVGYGNVAGFLMNKGVMTTPTAPPSSSSGVSLTTASGEAINPITGTVQEERPLPSDMTDEEKEREAEKLFVLFDRLEKTGAMPSSANPIRKMAEKGMLG